MNDDKTVRLVYHDSDGSVYCYNANSREVPYPESWPNSIADVPTFARARDISYLK